MTNRDAAEAVIARLPEEQREGWQATLARTLAAAVDETGQAAAAAQYRAVMQQLEAETTQVEVNPLDELNRRRAERERARTAAGGASSG